MIVLAVAVYVCCYNWCCWCWCLLVFWGFVYDVSGLLFVLVVYGWYLLLV